MPQAHRLPRHAWVQIAMRTLRHLSIAVLASVVVSYLIVETMSQGFGIVGLAASIAAPLVLGGPMIFFLTLRHYQLEMAYERLEAAAARDSLTQCLNHGAFVAEVTALLETPQSQGGVLLVIDADHFKAVNDRFGHACGDTALKLIAASIRGTLDASQTVGRLGGEEFGVYLPGATRDAALRHATEIGQAVRAITLDAGDQTCTLSVSIGGAAVAGPGTFGEMFRRADERLYHVKNSGRDNADIISLAPDPRGAVSESAPAPPLIYRGQKVANS